MDLGETLAGIGTVDLLIGLYFIGFFVLGFAQGTIRRLLGILSILFSFLLAASLAGPLSEFLGNNWRQFSPEYSYMVGFLVAFVASSAGSASCTRRRSTPSTSARSASWWRRCR